MKTKLLSDQTDTERSLIFWCPGCDEAHPFRVLTADSQARPRWEWNGDLDKPTCTPSLLVWGSEPGRRCHLYLTDGVIHFLADCWHSLRNTNVPLPDLPDFWTD